MSELEILAPCGSQETLVAAVRAGADAVYLGGNAFNARKNAENFDADGLFAAVQYCHIRGVRVYLTLNTLISDEEMPRALALAKYACFIGIDGIIVQDLGLIRQLRAAAPTMPLHGSTQMAVHTPAGVRQLAMLGFKRVVLARELSKTEISEIATTAAAENIELELFIHGALCMSVSGQCYMSALLGQRSGNRGLCAGPCRLPFMVQNGTGYDLSLKDLSLIEEVNELQKLGIISVKIEGRMKRPEYVAAAVDACKKAVDRTLTNTDLQKLKDVFSRSGFTKGYFEGKLGKEMFGTRQKEDVLSSTDVIASLHALYRAERPAIPITLSLSVNADCPSELIVFDGVHYIHATGDIPQSAINRPLDAEYAENQLKKTGGTPYFVTEFSCTIENGLALTASTLNALRRSALEQLNDVRGKSKPIPFKEIALPKPIAKPYKTPKLYLSVTSVLSLPANLTDIDTLYIPLFTTDSEIKALLLKNMKVGVKIPRALFGSEEKIYTRLEFVKELGVKIAVAGNIGAVTIARDLGFEIHGGFSLNVYNSSALGKCKDLGIREQVVSFELSLKQIESLSNDLPIGLYAYGRLPLMLLRNCPAKNGGGCDNCQGNIIDRKNIAFPLHCENNCTELLNSKPLWLADRLPELKNIDSLLLDFSGESAEETAQIISAYKHGAEPPKNYTRGLYYKGVI